MVSPANQKLRKWYKGWKRQTYHYAPDYRYMPPAPQPQNLDKLHVEFNRQALECKKLLTATKAHLLTKKHALVVQRVLEAHCQKSDFQLGNYLLRRFLYNTDVGLDWWGFRVISKLTLTLTIDLYLPPTTLERLFHGAAYGLDHHVHDLIFLLSPTRPVRALGGKTYNKYTVWQDHLQNLDVFSLNLSTKGDRKPSEWKADRRLDKFVNVLRDTEIVLRAREGRAHIWAYALVITNGINSRRYSLLYCIRTKKLIKIKIDFGWGYKKQFDWLRTFNKLALLVGCCASADCTPIVVNSKAFEIVVAWNRCDGGCEGEEEEKPFCDSVAKLANLVVARGRGVKESSTRLRMLIGLWGGFRLPSKPLVHLIAMSWTSTKESSTSLQCVTALLLRTLINGHELANSVRELSLPFLDRNVGSFTLFDRPARTVGWKESSALFLEYGESLDIWNGKWKAKVAEGFEPALAGLNVTQLSNLGHLTLRNFSDFENTLNWHTYHEEGLVPKPLSALDYFGMFAVEFEATLLPVMANLKTLEANCLMQRTMTSLPRVESLSFELPYSSPYPS
ncbi:hypothetical protein BDV96DRAFT_660759 [Lophiotrema nucula]|uniref:Uncharacterized protein n=1 Tax=Lophiotrema nucula TaxID=690887 RepID=A0A6A5Z7P3_9PLEO|nr:hypothetical protein BDV96DRAFT_660759 [Lophiotrema nucula]